MHPNTQEGDFRTTLQTVQPAPPATANLMIDQKRVMRPTSQQLRERNVSGIPFPYGLSREEVDFIRAEKRRGVSTTELANLFFGNAQPRQFMRVRKIEVMPENLLSSAITKGALTTELGAIKIPAPKKKKQRAKAVFPFGLTDDDMLDLFNAYNGGLGVKRLAKKFFRDDSSRGQARVRRLLSYGQTEGFLTLRPVSEERRRAGSMGGKARAKIYKKVAPNLSALAATKGLGQASPAKAETVTLSVEKSRLGEARVFAEAANIYLSRLRRAMREENLDLNVIRASAILLRENVDELSVSLGKE